MTHVESYPIRIDGFMDILRVGDEIVSGLPGSPGTIIGPNIDKGPYRLGIVIRVVIMSLS